MKYIPAEKLIAEIERRKIRTERRLDNIVPIKRKDTMDEEQVARIELRNKVDKAYLNGVWITLRDILSFIASLQQEQSHKSFCEENCKGYRDTGGKCFFGFDCSAKKVQEQPEVEFEKEYKSYMQSRKDDISGNAVTVNMKDLAHHFWNKGFNARKEE